MSHLESVRKVSTRETVHIIFYIKTKVNQDTAHSAFVVRVCSFQDPGVKAAHSPKTVTSCHLAWCHVAENLAIHCGVCYS